MQLFILWFSLAFSMQDKEIIRYDHSFFEIDHLGAIYLVQGLELIKFNEDGQQLAVYSDSQLGNVKSIDVSDPLRILIFHSDFNQIVYLDNTLAVIGNEINLYDFSDNETDLVCSSQKSGFWLYNSIDNQALHISASGTILTKSMLLDSFFDDAEISFIQEHDNNLYLLYSGKGVLCLDQNGQFMRKLSIPGIQGIQFMKNRLVYQTDQGIYAYRKDTPNDDLLMEKASLLKHDLKLKNNQVYISNTKSISIRNLSF